jgi:molecular chaperone DnaK (HSP70)
MKISIVSFILGLTCTQAFAPQLSHKRRLQNVQVLLHSSIEDDDDFIMPDAGTLISDIPESQRGIGVGIDLGTTNSAISILTDDGNPKLIKVEGKSTIPSIVTIQQLEEDEDDDEDGPFISAEVQMSNYDDDDDDDDMNTYSNENGFTYRHVKRVIGMGTTTAAANAEVVPHLVIRTASQRRKGKSLNKKSKTEGSVGLGLENLMKEARENPVRLSLPEGIDADIFEENVKEENEGTVSPELVSSVILEKLITAAEEETGERITRLVIGVPAYFNDMQRDATVRAAEIASSIPKERIRLLREPEAAALAYGIGKQQIGKGDEEQPVLVFDLGGGTFDVSILEVGGGIYEVLATGGNIMLGGSDFDARIAQHCSKIMTKNGCVKNYWRDAGDVAQKLVTSAEQIRIALSNTREVVLGLPITAEGWLEMENPKDVILSTRKDDEKYQDITDAGSSNGSRAIVKFSRKAFEQMCLEEFLALLRPVREVAILAGAMLPGDASPSAVEAVLQMEEELEMELAQNADTFADFYDESGEAEEEPEDDDISQEMLLQLKEFADPKDQKKKQQKGRKRARNTQKDERKFREQKRKADEDARRRSNTQNTKVRDGINGRRITQVVLVGGATRMPAIGRLLAATTGVVPQKTVNPDECVALGCAVQVGILDGINTELQVLSPIEAAMMRALAKKRGVEVKEKDDDFDDFDDFDVEGAISETVNY